MMELTQHFGRYAWALSLQQMRQSFPEEINHLCALSQAFKIVALLYGRRILDVLTETLTTQDDLVSKLVGLTYIWKDDEVLFKCVLWVIFVAGLECRSRAQNDSMVEYLGKFWTATSFLNVITAAKILPDYWDKEAGETPTRWIFDK
ncbi:hypothetical protein PDIG_57640 [Penicillium digitatum PHI26]|uniref:C6 transcription factor n=3 Tax=Penicillium digitatum TaxID=36651 RepID=K9G5E8_PEND2|nr:hypothetical protein PDIP_67150 [Penicillium digitatum Pd1]EKV08563.1 hypothetical protein PDIP_67150 [Penicillium digitatum Pd1]EKV10073.1 hypothetical protein PDIG_57640 [Penicillium digitatum PHI26]KAG0158645.1 hypothetical protein PDIDSM_6162 [Penicillium digitatum]